MGAVNGPSKSQRGAHPYCPSLARPHRPANSMARLGSPRWGGSGYFYTFRDRLNRQGLAALPEPRRAEDGGLVAFSVPSSGAGCSSRRPARKLALHDLRYHADLPPPDEHATGRRHAETRSMIGRWGILHTARCALGLAATLICPSFSKVVSPAEM